jgi:hypothetical protein
MSIGENTMFMAIFTNARQQWRDLFHDKSIKEIGFCLCSQKCTKAPTAWPKDAVKA